MRFKTISACALAAMGAALATSGSSAQESAQESAWAYFESDGLMQAGTVTAAGDQLIIKCDERGDGKVSAVLYSSQRLKPPAPQPQPRDLRMRFDGGSPQVVSWPHFEQTAVAMNTRRARQLPEFLGWLADANTLQVIFDPVDGGPITVDYVVTGAREAIGRVYETCGDSTNPLG